VKPKFRTLAVGAASVLAATIAAPLPATAADTQQYAYFGATGGTQIEAVGTTISSSMTAMSQIGGVTQPGSSSNKLLTVQAAHLASVGTIETSEVSTAAGDGWKLTGHARTAHVSLLDGVIKLDAVETTTTSQFNSDGGSGSSETRFVGLTIGGKTYPVDLAKNTRITVPGVVSVVLNYQAVGISPDGVATQGAGLVVTLLKSAGTAAIGSTIVLNPSYGYVAKSNNPGGLQLGGAAYGSYVYAHVGDAVKVESGLTAFEVMPPSGTNGAVLENHTARVSLANVLNATAIASTAEGASSPALNYSKLATRTANVNVFPSLLGAVIHADAIGSNASVVKENGETTMTGGTQLLNLTIAGNKIPVNVGPNTTIHVANLGFVTINEQKQVAVDGFMHGIQVMALHVVLDTARAGLPIGAEIQVGVSQAIVWG
jgi:hypothetical protein